MTENPEDLRQWRLPRGRHGLPREVVARSQRERLLAAVVRVVAAKGYEATSVADILEEAGVGRESFYEQFRDKRDCLLVARGLLVENLEATVAAAYGEPGPWPDRIREALAAALEWFAADPAAARVTVVELAGIGPSSRELFQADFHRFVALLDDGLDGPALRPQLPRASRLAVGATLASVYGEVVSGRTTELPSRLPRLTYELLVPFLGEEAARAEAEKAARSGSQP